MLRYSFTFLAAFLLYAVPTQAAVCMSRDRMVDFLATKYNERTVAAGIVNEEVVAQLFVSDAGTWTVVMINTAMTSCIAAAGSDWQEIEPQEPESPEY